MATPKLASDLIKEAYDLYCDEVANGLDPIGQARPGRSALSAAAKRLVALTGLSRKGAESRICDAVRLFGGEERGPAPEPERPKASSWLEHISLPEELPPIEEDIERITQITDRKREARSAKDWRTIFIRGSGPVGLANIGDPHTDNEGCNWRLLRRDIEIIKNTEGLFCGNVGDSVDNWFGRLLKLKGETSVTDVRSWRFAKWLLYELGPKIVYWLLGNHDSWNDGAHIFRALGDRLIQMDDWQVRFVLQFDNGLRVPVWASHNFKGSSIYNKLHGAERADLFSRGAARLYISGHHHEWACHEEECPERKITYWKIKARGYKFVDSYAENLQFFPQQSGATVTAVFDPDAKHEAQIIRCFPDLEEAAEFLTWKREKWKAGK